MNRIMALLLVFSVAYFKDWTAYASFIPGEMIVKINSDSWVKKGAEKATEKATDQFQDIAQDLQNQLAELDHFKSSGRVEVQEIEIPSTQKSAPSEKTPFAVFKVNPDQLKAAFQVLKKDPRVAYAEPNFLYQTADIKPASLTSEQALGDIHPSDPEFEKLWNLKNRGQSDFVGH